MWCYQKPDFEALVLTELQRQQQRSQFCDTLLKAGGVSVPAHSCILSAISPHISSALSSSPVPPAGQSRHVEFQTLGACTLLHIIRLLYSGEMAGEGESEKHQAICAAAKLGIGGLVEVNKSQARGGGRGGVAGEFAEVGVQTEGNDFGRSKWRREVKDGSTYLWKETPSGGGKDIGTQTEEMQVDLPPPAPPAASFETIDMGAFQSLRQMDPHQFVPITIVYPPDENQTVLVQSDAPVCVQETAACPPAPPPLFHCSRQPEPQSGWADPQGADDDEEWEAEQIEQFEGNIAGFISYFLNPRRAEGAPGRRRAGRRSRGARGQRGAGRPRGRPRGRPPGRSRRGLTQRVDVQEVGMGRLQQQFLNRWGTRTPRTGQGGGAIGRKLLLKEREVPPAARRAPSRRSRRKNTEVSQSRDTELENSPTQLHQASLAGSTDRHLRAKSTPVPTPSHRIHSRPLLSASRSSLSDPLRSPAASCVSAASSDLLTARLPSHENQPEHIDRLLEEVMKGLDILPQNDRNGAPHSVLELPGSSGGGGGSPGNPQNKQQGPMTDSEVPVLQQQYEGELTEILENFLQSFEQQVDGCDVRENETGNGSSSEAGQPHTSPSRSKRAETPTETPRALQQGNKKALRPSDPPETSEPQSEGSEMTDRASSSERARKSENTRAKRPKRKRQNYLFSLEKKKTKRSASSGDRKVTREAEPERNGLLPDQNCLQEKKTKTRASTGSNPQNWKRDSYPIRSRFREEHILDTTAYLEVPLSAGQSDVRRHSRPRTKRQLVRSSNGESAAAPPRPQPADSCCADDQSEANQDRNEEDLTVQPRGEAEGPRGSGQKRSNEDPSEEAAAEKRICFDRRETSKSAELVSSTDQEWAMDVETVSQTTGLRSCFQGAKQEYEEITEERFTGKEEEDGDDDMGLKKRTDPEQNGDCDEDLDEDVDVIGDSSPVPDLVRPGQSFPCVEEEEEVEEDEDAGDLEIDVVGER